MTARAMTNRRTLLAGTALAATLGLAGWAAPAAAQGFNGTGTVVSGASIGSGNATITVNAAEAIINWNVPGASTATNVPFLSQGNSVTFQDGTALANYTVLNRVFPVDAGSGAALNATISLDGTITSTITSKPGGNILFYSPHGIITNIGTATTSINVGSLLLTTSDIDTSNGGSLYTFQTGGLSKVGFLAATDGNATVKVGAGTTITASGNPTSSLAGYVGIFAPRIEQGGTVRASGAVGYAAGETGQFTFTDGLVSILISVGTDETQHQGIVHTGTTGGPAVGGPTPRNIQMVAMPKNTALTMLLGGSIGFDNVVATPDGSAVVLSAGWQPTTTAAEIALGLGNMTINNATIAGDPTVWATGTLTVAPQFISAAQPGLTRFAGLTQFNVGNKLVMDAGTDTGSLIDFTSTLQVNALRVSTGEDVRITSTGGTIAVVGDATIDDTGQAAFTSVPPTTGADGVGGNVAIFIDKGSLTVGGDFTVTANGIDEDGGDFGGNGIAQSIDMRVSGGGTISAVGPLAFAADGFGGFAANDGGTGGTGTGGVLTLRDDGGLLDFPSVDLSAKGFGASGLAATPVPSDGLGGQIAVIIAGKAQSWASLTANASAFNDGGNVAGNALGNLGGVKLQVTGTGDLTLGDLTLTNDAVIQSGGGTANIGKAGGLDLLVNAGGKLTVTGATQLSASALNPLGNPQIGSDMTGGQLAVTVDGAGSTLKVGYFTAYADAEIAGAGQIGGTALAGTAAVGATNGGLLQIVTGTGPTTPQFQLGAVAHAGYGPVSSSIQGNIARLYVQGGTIDAAGIDLNVSAAAVGDGTAYDGNNTGFDATGGKASVEMLSGGIGAGKITAGNLFVNAKGEALTLINTGPTPATNPFADYTGPLDATRVVVTGSGGTGTGGTARLVVDSGTLDTGSIFLHANGLGGPGAYNFLSATPLTAGDGIGGQVFYDQSGGTVSAVTLNMLSQGQGGGAYGSLLFDAPAAIPGVGLGGLARATLSGGSTSLSSALRISATAIGGDGGNVQSNGASVSATAGAIGDDSLGLAELLMPAGSTANLTALSTIVDASATGGGAGRDLSSGIFANGGAALGGTARISLADGAFDLGITNALAGALGGPGATGGDATGGTAAFLLVDTLAAPATTRITKGLLVLATPSGGAGNVIDGVATPGTTKLTVRAGRATSALVVNGDLDGENLGIIIPGDGFVGNFGSIPVQVNGTFLVRTSRDINMSVDAGGGVNATGQIQLASGGAITTTGDGVLSALQSVRIDAFKSINMAGLSAGTSTLLLASDPATGLDGPITVSALSSGGLVTAFGSSVDITSPGALSFDTSAASAGDFAAQAAGNLTVGQIDATGLVKLASTSGNLRNTAAVTGNAIQLQAGGNVAADAALNTTTTLSATAGGTFTSALALNVPGNTSIDAAGGITVPSLTSGGTTFLRSSGAPLALTLTSTGAVTLSAQSATIISPSALTFASATTTAGNLTITTPSTLTLGGASSSAALNLNAGSLLTVNGLAEGATITVRSRDIAIGSTGRLGRRGLTTTIALINTAPLGGTIIGGTGQAEVWSLDGAEVGRLFADQSIAISPAPVGNAASAGSTAGPTSIGATALSYGTASTANLGSGGQFIVTTPGAIQVNGPVNLATSTNADGLQLTG